MIIAMIAILTACYTLLELSELPVNFSGNVQSKVFIWIKWERNILFIFNYSVMSTVLVL